MKKIITFALILMLIASMTVPAYAVTPSLGVPDMPEIPDISDNVEVELPDDAFDGYIPGTTKPEEPTEPPVEEPIYPNWCDWVKGWFEWWKDTVQNFYG